MSSATNREPIDKLLLPFQEFFNSKAAGGIVLMFCAVAAMIWGNSPWHESYHHFWEMPLSVGAGAFAASHSLHWWVNDGLMAVFFFVVGLEIKRELLVGELSSIRLALLPIAAAAGGMLVPAVIYFALNQQGPQAAGWGIPMATDIAFALGVLALLGDRIPARLKIFLAAVAIVDDIGAVLVIAIFYTSQIHGLYLVAAAVVLFIVFLGNVSGVRTPFFYAIMGLFVWLAFLGSGIHSTVAGVLLAMLIPARARVDSEAYINTAEGVLEKFRKHSRPGESVLASHEQHAALLEMQNAATHAETPLQRLEHGLVPWVDFFIMPLFALANAGVYLGGGASAALGSSVAMGIILGLVLGKPLGIMGAVLAMVRTGLAELPGGVSMRQIFGASLLAAIGFTMSLFIGALAFDSESLLMSSKTGIIAASAIAGFCGWIVLRNAPE